MTKDKRAANSRLYWRRHVPGDHLQATVHLSLEEEGALLRLLDIYWRAGQLPADVDECARLIRAPERGAMVGALLRGYFRLKGARWVNDELDDERGHAEQLSRKRAESGRRGRAAQLQSSGENSSGQLPGNSSASAGRSQHITTHHIPPVVPRTQKPRTPPKPRQAPAGASLAGFDDFWAMYPSAKRVKKKAARDEWRKLARDELTRAAILEGLRRALTSDDWKKDGGKYIPHPSNWLHDERWNDETLRAPRAAPRTAAPPAPLPPPIPISDAHRARGRGEVASLKQLVSSLPIARPVSEANGDAALEEPGALGRS